MPFLPDSPDLATLQAWLADAETAYHALVTGQQARVVTYGLGEGQRSVTYTQASACNLLAYIQSLKAQIARFSPRLGQRRRAIGVSF